MGVFGFVFETRKHLGVRISGGLMWESKFGTQGSLPKFVKLLNG